MATVCAPVRGSGDVRLAGDDDVLAGVHELLDDEADSEGGRRRRRLACRRCVRAAWQCGMEQSGGVLVLARVCCAQPGGGGVEMELCVRLASRGRHLEGRVRPSVHEREEVLPFYRQELG
jgi:hypothetical protein